MNSERGVGPVVVNTLLEHNSNEIPGRMIRGASLIRLPIDMEGFVDLNELETLLSVYNQEWPIREEAHQARDCEWRFERSGRIQRPGRDQSNRSPVWRAFAGGCGTDGRTPQSSDGRARDRLSRSSPLTKCTHPSGLVC